MGQDTAGGPPPWLKAMQNGSLGEARARAFLLNRFWVLERSVDVQGADLIIQRRLTGRNLLERQAPRLGVVQVKFFGSPATSHFIHEEYVTDEKGEPRDEFFLLCHHGAENDARMFLVFARDIVEAFPRTNRSGNDGFAINFDVLALSERFHVTDSRLALNRIEHQLEVAEFTKNRRFLEWALPSARTELGAIHPDYREPLGNWWGDLPKGFMEIKKVARDAMMHVEEIHELLLDVADATDPAIAAERLSQIRYHCRAGNRWSISLPDDLDNQEFFDACRLHKVMVDHLRADGLLDAFIRMPDELSKHLVSFLEPRLPLSPTILHRFVIRYDPATFAILTVESSLSELSEYLGMSIEFDKWRSIKGAPDFRSHAVEKASPGCIEYHWMPGRGSAEAMLAALRSGDSYLYNDCLDAVFAAKYGEPHELLPPPAKRR